MAEEWIPDLETIAELWRKEAVKAMARLNNKKEWDVNDQRLWGACRKAEELADQLDGLVSRIKREAECKPPEAMESDFLTWEREARRIILNRDSTTKEMQLASWICAMGVKLRKKD